MSTMSDANNTGVSVVLESKTFDTDKGACTAENANAQVEKSNENENETNSFGGGCLNKEKRSKRKKKKKKKHREKEKINYDFPAEEYDPALVSQKTALVVSSRAACAYAAEPELLEQHGSFIENNSNTSKVPQVVKQCENDDVTFHTSQGKEPCYSADSSSRISRLRQKIKTIEEDRESLRSQPSREEANEESTRHSSAISSKQDCSADYNYNEEGLDKSNTIDFESSSSQQFSTQKTAERKNPPPTSLKGESNGFARKEIVATHNEETMPPYSNRNNDAIKPTTRQLTILEPQGGDNERNTGSMQENNPAYLHNISLSIAKEDFSDEKIRLESAAESYSAYPGAFEVTGGLSPQIKKDRSVSPLTHSASESYSDITNLSPGTAVAVTGLNGKKDESFSGPVLESAAESYTITPRLQRRSDASPEELILRKMEISTTRDFVHMGCSDEGEDDLPTITAVKVQERDVENLGQRESFIRQQIINQSVRAIEVINDTKAKRRRIGLAVMSVFVALGIVLGLVLGLPSHEQSILMVTSSPSAMPSNSPTEPILPTLDYIVQEGKVRCGVYNDIYGFGMMNNETGKIEGLDVDLVRSQQEEIFDSNRSISYPSYCVL